MTNPSPNKQKDLERLEQLRICRHYLTAWFADKARDKAMRLSSVPLEVFYRDLVEEIEDIKKKLEGTE